LLMFFSLW